jgi:hypothetical protein
MPCLLPDTPTLAIYVTVANSSGKDYLKFVKMPSTKTTDSIYRSSVVFDNDVDIDENTGAIDFTKGNHGGYKDCLTVLFYIKGAASTSYRFHGSHPVDFWVDPAEVAGAKATKPDCSIPHSPQPPYDAQVEPSAFDSYLRDYRHVSFVYHNHTKITDGHSVEHGTPQSYYQIRLAKPDGTQLCADPIINNGDDGNHPYDLVPRWSWIINKIIP